MSSTCLQAELILGPLLSAFEAPKCYCFLTSITEYIQQGMSAGYCHETSFVFFSRFKLNPITATLRWLFLAVLSSPTSGRKAWPRSPLAASPSSSRYIVGSLGHLSEIICLRSISIICFLDTSHFAHFTQRVTQWFYISTGVSCHCTMVNRAKYFRWCHVFFLTVIFLTDTFQTSLIIFSEQNSTFCTRPQNVNVENSLILLNLKCSSKIFF